MRDASVLALHRRTCGLGNKPGSSGMRRPSDGHLGRKFLRGTERDAANLVLAAAGHNLHLLRAWLAWLLAFLLSLLAPSHQTGSGRQPRPQAA